MSTPLQLYIVRSPRARAEVIVAATDETHARSFPPYSNWRTLLKFGSWSPTENVRAKVRHVGVATPETEAGPLLFGST